MRLRKTEHYDAPLGSDQGRGVAAGFWFNRGGETTGSVTVAPDGSITLLVRTVDVGGSRRSISMMAAAEPGIPLDKISAATSDINVLGFDMVTVDSRSTFASGMVVIYSARKAIQETCGRAAKIWGMPEVGAMFENGHFRPASSNVGKFETLSIAPIAKQAGATGGAIAGHSEFERYRWGL